VRLSFGGRPELNRERRSDAAASMPASLRCVPSLVLGALTLMAAMMWRRKSHTGAETPHDAFLEFLVDGGVATLPDVRDFAPQTFKIGDERYAL